MKYVQFNLEEASSLLLKHSNFATKGNHSMMLYNDKQGKVLLLALAKDKTLEKHTAPGLIQVSVAKGQVIFKLEDDVFHLKEMDQILVPDRLPHSVHATTDAVIMIHMHLK